MVDQYCDSFYHAIDNTSPNNARKALHIQWHLTIPFHGAPNVPIGCVGQCISMALPDFKPEKDEYE